VSVARALQVRCGSRWLSAGFVAAVCLGWACAARAERAVTLAWNPSTGPVAGYYVYAWEENATAPMRVDAGNSTVAQVSGLKEGLRYVFQVTAYNTSRVESVPTSGLPYTVPVPIELLPPLPGSTSCRIRFPAAPGRWYELQASTDLVQWTTIWQTGLANNYSWVDYQDPRSRYYKTRYYRLQVH
jgi:hypothetical protein